MLEEKESLFSFGRISIVLMVFVSITLLSFVGIAVYGKSFDNKTLPGLSIGTVPIGGLQREEVTTLLQGMIDKLIADGISVQFDTYASPLTIYPIVVSESSSIELVDVDVAAEVDFLLQYGKHATAVQRGMRAIVTSFTRPSVQLRSVIVDEKQLHSILEKHLNTVQHEPKNASLVIDTLTPLSWKVTTSSPGLVFDRSQFSEDVRMAWSSLRSPEITLRPLVQEPTIVSEDVESLIPYIPRIINGGDITLSYTDTASKRERTWSITPNRFSEWLTVERAADGGVLFAFVPSSTEAYLDDTIVSFIQVDPQDARFSIDSNGKVVEFQGSKTGVTLDKQETHRLLNAVLEQRLSVDAIVTSTILLPVHTVEPTISTAAANDLGIKDLLGQGFSNFSGSPKNRIANMRNAVQKLNGILIPPGETFSTIAHTGPYTETGGYLPELVIKGDEITPEIGGGLCQIGTTLFRMAMNSGLDIVERRNHSLVVNYYNDLQNGLPGTDATLYDPAPDFRFKNDTNNYILIQTDMNVTTGLLTFSLWGTSDGREASYSQPVVHQWMSPGPTKIVETTKLAPGEKKCQHAYRGAQTSFTYTRTMSDGTKQDRVFESYYRPLPEICLVGVAAEADAVTNPPSEDESAQEPLRDPYAITVPTAEEEFVIVE